MMRKRGVGAFSITDHDALAAYDDIDGAALGGATLVRGVEINSTYKESEVHVLGFGMAEGAPELANLIERNRAARRARVERMLLGLARAGHQLMLDQVLAEAADGATLGRPHVAKALVRAGVVEDVPAAFRTLLGRGGAGYVPSIHVSPIEAIEAVTAAGGVPVLAHPGRVEDPAIVDELAERGLVGLEVFHPSHSGADVSRFRDKAKNYGLVMTAGSDFHDRRYSPLGVGVEVDTQDIAPFLELVA